MVPVRHPGEEAAAFLLRRAWAAEAALLLSVAWEAAAEVHSVPPCLAEAVVEEELQVVLMVHRFLRQGEVEEVVVAPRVPQCLGLPVAEMPVHRLQEQGLPESTLCQQLTEGEEAPWCQTG